MTTPIKKPELLEIIVSAINDCGWNVLYLSNSHPFKLQIYRGEQSFRVKIYIWNITHGGGAARPLDEYRIQITGIGNQFTHEAEEKTLILGWWGEMGVFAGFDIRKHSEPFGSSPSLQIRKEYLERALLTGFAPCDKGNQEIAIAFRPDFLVDYIRYLEPLHDFGESPNEIEILDEVLRNPEIKVNDEDIPIQNAERRITIVKVNRILRDASFRKRVLTAYRNSCAFCGLQLRLIDAAHIVPVNFENSNDETRNGIALCALHHRAFDQSLVTLIENYQTRVNNEIIQELQQNGMIGGFETFRNNLKPQILRPTHIHDAPFVEYIRTGNRIRGWRDDQIQP